MAASEAESALVPAEVLVLAVGLVGATLVWLPAPLIGIEQFRLPKELATLGITLVAATVAAKRTSRWRLDRIALIATACFVWALLSLWLRADNPWLGWRMLGGYWCGLVAYVLVRQQAHRTSVPSLVLASVACAGAAVATTTLLEHLGVASGSSLVHRAPSGVFGHRNHAAHFVALSLPASLALLRADADQGYQVSRPRRVARFLGLACALLGGASIVVTRSRAAWLAMAAVIGIVAATALWPRGEGGAVTGGGAWTHREAATTWLAALLAGAVLGTVLPSPLGWQSSLETSVRRVVEFDQGSGRGRLVQYATTFAMARANPMFGVGPGNWTVEYPRFARRGDPNLLPGPVSAPRLPLNDWLGTLSEVGAPVLIAVAVLAILVSLPATVAIVRGYRTGRVHTADVALLALLVEVVLLGSLDAVMQSPLGPIVTALLVAVLARRWLTLRVRSGSPRVGWGGAAAMVAGSLFLTALAGRRLSAAVQYGDDATLAAFRAAAAIDPSDFTAQFFAGVAYTRMGDCRSAAPYLRAARVLLPYAESVRVVGRVCASRSRAP